MSKDRNPADYTLKLEENMHSFLEEFWEEFRKQEQKPNKSSDVRMRKILKSFNERIYKPYKQQSLGKDVVGLDSILGEQ